MIEYLALQIIKGNLTYRKVMSKFAEHKKEIDAILIDNGRKDLIEENITTPIPEL